jgi:hypothetical protein
MIDPNKHARRNRDDCRESNVIIEAISSPLGDEADLSHKFKLGQARNTLQHPDGR